MTDTDPLVHTSRPDTPDTALCGAAVGQVADGGRVKDPNHPATFNCPACLAILTAERGGPADLSMGGTAP